MCVLKNYFIAVFLRNNNDRSLYKINVKKKNNAF